MLLPNFNALNPSDVSIYPNAVIAGDIPNGTTVNLHPSSSLGGMLTLKICNPATGTRDEIRYKVVFL